SRISPDSASRPCLLLRARVTCVTRWLILLRQHRPWDIRHWLTSKKGCAGRWSGTARNLARPACLQQNVMLSLSEDQVKEFAGVDAVIDALRTAFARDFSQTLQMPVRSSLALPNQGVLLVMPAYDSFLNVAGIKTVTVTRGRGVNATYELIDPCSGM